MGEHRDLPTCWPQKTKYTRRVYHGTLQHAYSAANKGQRVNMTTESNVSITHTRHEETTKVDLNADISRHGKNSWTKRSCSEEATKVELDTGIPRRSQQNRCKRRDYQSRSQHEDVTARAFPDTSETGPQSSSEAKRLPG